eukprot:Phypoly_transcript_19406.p1 GENE.Phypoly_transcript_19406~~Phypoly_transcript_19406.p1  ORF type:complete len:212 (+),score=20.17 Phypoly_transcript_19406:39-638(+)
MAGEVSSLLHGKLRRGKTPLYVALVFAVVSVIFMIASLSTYWYHNVYSIPFGISLDTKYYWTYAIVNSQKENYTGQEVKTVFEVCLSFLVIGLVAWLAFLVLVLLRFANRNYFNQGWIVGTVAILLMVISFLAFLGITEAFKKGTQGCNSGPCKSFRGSESAIGDNWHVSWGPGPGWWLLLVAIGSSAVATASMYKLPA